jgi:hypothetical protein
MLDLPQKTGVLKATYKDKIKMQITKEVFGLMISNQFWKGITIKIWNNSVFYYSYGSTSRSGSPKTLHRATLTFAATVAVAASCELQDTSR